jgi:hypothetical protein
MPFNCIHAAAELKQAAAPRILINRASRHRQGLRCTLRRRQVGLQHRFGHYGREEIVLPLTAMEPWFLGCEKSPDLAEWVGPTAGPDASEKRGEE